MAQFSGSNWFRASVAGYLVNIKNWVLGLLSAQAAATTQQIEQAKTDLRSEFGSITGTFKGSFTTYALMPSGTGIKNGDWAVLTEDDATDTSNFHESGIYVKGAAGWSFVADITGINELNAIIATDPEFLSGLPTDKVPNVAQLTAKFELKADINGNQNNFFNVKAADEGSTWAVNAAQFALVTVQEADDDWASVIAPPAP
jgi:hypothetical protein